MPEPVILLLVTVAVFGAIGLVIVAIASLAEETEYAPYRAYTSRPMLDRLIEERIAKANEYLREGYPSLHANALKDVRRLQRRYNEIRS